MVGVLETLVFRPPAHVQNVERVVRVGRKLLPYPDYRDMSTQSRSFVALAAYSPREFTRMTADRADVLHVLLTSSSFFDLLGFHAHIGRFYSSGENRLDGPHLAVVSYAFWRSRLGADPHTIGASLSLGGEPYTIIGVTPPGFTGVELDQVDAFLPIESTKTFGGTAAITSRDFAWVRVLGRLRDGVTPPMATAETTTLWRQLNEHESGYLQDMLRKAPLTVTPVMAERRELLSANTASGRRVQLSVWIAALSIAVFLISCANVANLTVVRARRDASDVALQYALGAPWRAIAVRSASELFIAVLAGAACAIGVALVAHRMALEHLFSLPHAGTLPFAPRIFAALLGGIVVATGIAVLGPLVALRQVAPTRLLRSMPGRRRTASPLFRQALLAVQLALVVVLLAVAASFARSLHDAHQQGVGIRGSALLVSPVNFPQAGVTGGQVQIVEQRLQEDLRRVDGVKDVAITASGRFQDLMPLNVWLPGAGVDSVTASPLARVGDLERSIQELLLRNRFTCCVG